jgi:hypothetical protein
MHVPTDCTQCTYQPTAHNARAVRLHTMHVPTDCTQCTCRPTAHNARTNRLHTMHVPADCTQCTSVGAPDCTTASSEQLGRQTDSKCNRSQHAAPQHAAPQQITAHSNTTTKIASMFWSTSSCRRASAARQARATARLGSRIGFQNLTSRQSATATRL